jgi:hypothetical protein
MVNSPKNPENKKQKVVFYYLKTGNYRTYHVDGVFGGVTPKGGIFMELFSEKGPTPDTVTHELNDNASLGQEISRQSKDGIIRQVEAGLVLDLTTAEAIRNWLDEKMDLVKSQVVKDKNK